MLLEYNNAPGNNPLGLLPAYRLYDNETYGRLVEKLGVDQVYIPSAGWGLEGAKIRCGSIEQRSLGAVPICAVAVARFCK